jgi:hypothetical protein
MPRNTAGFTLDDQDIEAAPLSAEDKAALERARADVENGRLHDHDDVAKRLRKRAADITGNQDPSSKRRI